MNYNYPDHRHIELINSLQSLHLDIHKSFYLGLNSLSLTDVLTVALRQPLLFQISSQRNLVDVLLDKTDNIILGNHNENK